MKINIKNNLDLIRLRQIVRKGLIKAYEYSGVEPFITIERINALYCISKFFITNTYNFLLCLYYHQIFNVSCQLLVRIQDIIQMNVNAKKDKVVIIKKHAKSIPIYNYYINTSLGYPCIEDIKISYVYNLLFDTNYEQTHKKEIMKKYEVYDSIKTSYITKYLYSDIFDYVIHCFVELNLWYYPIHTYEGTKCKFSSLSIYVPIDENKVRFTSYFVKCLCLSIYSDTILKLYELKLSLEDIDIICDVAAATVLSNFYFPYIGDNPICGEIGKIIEKLKKEDFIIDILLFLIGDVVKIVYTRLNDVCTAFIRYKSEGNIMNPPIPDDGSIFPPLHSISSIIGGI